MSAELGGQNEDVAKAQPIIDACTEPLIGLQYVTEFKSELGASESTWCVCNLCEVKFMSKVIISHVTCMKHRLKYMKEMFMNYHTMIYQFARNNVQKAVLTAEYAECIEAEEGRQKVKIKSFCVNDNKMLTVCKKRPAEDSNALSGVSSPPSSPESMISEDTRKEPRLNRIKFVGQTNVPAVLDNKSGYAQFSGTKKILESNTEHVQFVDGTKEIICTTSSSVTENNELPMHTQNPDWHMDQEISDGNESCVNDVASTLPHLTHQPLSSPSLSSSELIRSNLIMSRTEPTLVSDMPEVDKSLGLKPLTNLTLGDHFTDAESSVITTQSKLSSITSVISSALAKALVEHILKQKQKDTDKE